MMWLVFLVSFKVMICEAVLVPHAPSPHSLLHSSSSRKYLGHRLRASLIDIHPALMRSPGFPISFPLDDFGVNSCAGLFSRPLWAPLSTVVRRSVRYSRHTSPLLNAVLGGLWNGMLVRSCFGQLVEVAHAGLLHGRHSGGEPTGAEEIRRNHTRWKCFTRWRAMFWNFELRFHEDGPRRR